MMTLSFATAAPAVCLTGIAGDLGMSLAQRGLFLSAAFWGLTIAMLLAGSLADRWGFKLLLALSALLQVVGLIMISMAAVQRFAIIGGFILGFGTGIADALFTPIVCALYPDKRAKVSNLLHAFYPVGLIFSVSLILVLMRFGMTWRPIFRILGVLAVPYGLAILMLALPKQSHEGSRRLRARKLIFHGAFVLLVFSIFLSGVTELGPSSWLPNFVEEATKGSRTHGALGLILFGITMAAGRFCTSALVHRIGVKRLFIGGALLCSVSLLLAAMPVGTVFSIFWLCVLGFAVAGFWPTIMGCAGDRFPTAGASMYSLLGAAGNFGGVVGPVSIGFVAQKYSLNRAIALLAVAPVIIVMLMLMLLKSVRRDVSGV